MEKTLALALAFAGALSVSGCYTPQQQTGTLAGGAIGAGGGALIGSALTHGSAGGAIAGGLLSAGPRAKQAPGNGATRAAMRKRRPDEGAATRADRAASKGACLLLRRVAAGDGQCAGQRQRQRESFFHVSPVDSIERGADPV